VFCENRIILFYILFCTRRETSANEGLYEILFLCIQKLFIISKVPSINSGFSLPAGLPAEGRQAGGVSFTIPNNTPPEAMVTHLWWAYCGQLFIFVYSMISLYLLSIFFKVTFLIIGVSSNL
jgi:hypothetical protein